MKEKMSEEKKTILIYCGELLLFSILFLVLAILRFSGKIAYKETRREIFNYITIVGALWAFSDFIWMLCSKKRGAKNSLLDKILTLPLAIYLVVFDIISFINGSSKSEKFYLYAIAIVFTYASLIYLVEAIYHYFKPIPMLLEEENKNSSEEQKEEENK